MEGDLPHITPERKKGRREKQKTRLKMIVLAILDEFVQDLRFRWVEVELELNALDNPGSRRGSGNEKAVVSQGVALSVGLGGQVVVGTMNTSSGMPLCSYDAVVFVVGT
ncbi:unnamed protein product [Ilex paraguariensis]|uniref:PI4-kinase N-terminal domain-containing protein n=1 Tax=Ilex paraguariensis TaxID=185542 RepID=A0ABC8S9S5_9AQUA